VTGVSNALSALCAALSAISAMSVGAVPTVGLQSALNALSNRISAVVGGTGSVTSTEVSAVSAQAASALSDAISAGSVTAAALSARADSLAQAISVLSQATSVADAALSLRADSIMGDVRPRLNTTLASVISTATLTDIASMLVSLAAGATYDLRGFLMFEVSATGPVRFGYSAPALAAAGSFIKMELGLSNVSQNVFVAGAGVSAIYAVGYAALSAVAATTGGTALVSVSILTSTLKGLQIDGMLNTSAAGTFRIMGGGSGVNAAISVRGGFLRAVRVG
jgi:hypothetical protein